MKRSWTPFNAEVLKAEFLAIPQPDRGQLFFAMENYRDETGIVYLVKNYGDGLMMIRDKSVGSGRCLFFTVDGSKLVMLLAYKKESNEAPASKMKTARTRMKEYKK